MVKCNCAEGYLHYTQMDKLIQDEMLEAVMGMGNGFIRIKAGEPTVCILRGSCLNCPNEVEPKEVVNG